MRWRIITLVFVCLSYVIQISAQEVLERPEERDPAKAAQGRQQAADILIGVSPMKRAEINSWKMSHFGATDADYFAIEAHQAAVAQESDAAKANGTRLLSAPLARGWAYAESGGERGESRWPDFSNTDKYSNISFTLIRDIPYKPEPYGTSWRYGGFNYHHSYNSIEQPKSNQIRIQGNPDLKGLDLGTFFQTNLHFLEDFPAFMPDKPSKQPTLTSMNKVAIKPPSFSAIEALKEKADKPPPHSPISDSFAVTFARASRDTTIVTVFDLRRSVEEGGLRGYMFVTQGDTHEFASDLQRRLQQYAHPDNHSDIASILTLDQTFNTPGHGKSRKIRRIFLYGESELISDVVQICETEHCELIRRTNAPLELSDLERRLNVLSQRSIVSTPLTIVNGIPDSEEALKKMGPFLGRPEPWLKYREDVSSLLAATDHSDLATADELRNELIEGNNDVVLLFAHSRGGTAIFLGPEKLTVKEISEFPSRKRSTRRPRLAILFSCNTGQSPQQRKSFMGLGNSTEVDRLAQVLVKKGYFDRVLAPDHSFGPTEGLNVLQRLLNNPASTPNFHHWMNWAVNLIHGEHERG